MGFPIQKLLLCSCVVQCWWHMIQFLLLVTKSISSNHDTTITTRRTSISFMRFFTYGKLNTLLLCLSLLLCHWICNAWRSDFARTHSSEWRLSGRFRHTAFEWARLNLTVCSCNDFNIQSINSTVEWRSCNPPWVTCCCRQLDNQRYLVKHGLIVEKIAKERKLRHVFLFNDIIVAAKQKMANRSVFMLLVCVCKSKVDVNSC